MLISLCNKCGTKLAISPEGLCNICDEMALYKRVLTQYLIDLTNTEGKGNKAVYIDFVEKYLPKRFSNKSISDMVNFCIKNNIVIDEMG
jgi:hypothetical protein